jgi:predicted dehydrogenase
MRNVKVGIIGCGGIANGKHMPALSRLGNVEMVAFCDIVEERAQDAADKFGEPGSRVYRDYQEMLRKESDIEVIHVLTPNRSHAPITVAALEAGKHVMCEKPMSKDVEGARAMVAAAKRTGKKLTIGYQGRCRTDSLYLKQLCDAGELGDIYYARAIALRRRAVPTWGVFLNEYEQGGGPLIDIGTHALDLTLWMMNNYEPDFVLGATFRKLADTKNAANAWGPWDPEKFTVEDSAFGFIRFKNGAAVSLESSWALNVADPRESVTMLCGTKGGADMFDGLRINGEQFGKLWLRKVDTELGGVAFYDAASGGEPQDIEAATWISAVVNDTPLRVLPEQALVVTEILDAIYRSAKSGQAVKL